MTSQLSWMGGTCRQYTHKHCTYSAVQSLHKRGTHRTRLAQDLHNICGRLKRICHLVRTCCSLTCRLPRAHHLLHSLFLLPRHQNTHYNRDNTITSKNTQYIIEPFQDHPVDKQHHQESLWCENLQSGGNPRATFSTEQGAGRYCGEGLKSMRLKVEAKVLVLWITEGGKEQKNKVIAPCSNLEEKFQECSKSEGEILATIVETLGVDLWTPTKQLAAKEKQDGRSAT